MPFEGAFVKGAPELSWVANNSAKLSEGRAAEPDAPECWTVISSRAFGTEHKAS